MIVSARARLLSCAGIVLLLAAGSGCGNRPTYPKAHIAESLQERTGVYLVEAAESDGEESRVLRRRFRSIFDAELAAWSEDATLWPKRRDLATFRTWFNHEIQSLVVDLADADPFEE